MDEHNEYEGNTIEEAKEKAAQDLGVELENIEVEDVEEEKGFLGLSTKKVKVRIKSTDGWKKKAESFLNKVLPYLAKNYKISYVEEEENNLVSITGDDVGLAIGRHGRTIEALQLLLNIVVNKYKDAENKRRILLDIENYRQKRLETLEKIAKDYAKIAVQEDKPVTLEPMNSYERKIIHNALNQNDTVETKSEGEEPFRRVIVFPQKNK